MMRKILLFFIVLVSLSVADVVAQDNNVGNVDLSKYQGVDVGKLTDSQIKQLNQELTKRGMTFEQAKPLLKAQGASDKQLLDLEKRLRKSYPKLLADNTKVKLETANDKENDEENNDKAKNVVPTPSQGRGIIYTHEDSLVFGFNLFNNEKLTFEPSLNVPVSDDYVLGPGDEILIDIWGLSSQSYDLMVTSSGSIEIPMVGPIYIAGQTLKAARSNIESRLKTIYSDLGSRTSASIKTGQLRTIKVNVIGEVRVPGTYSLSGAATIFNALYLSCGPTRNGSFRNIQLIRDGRIVSTLDVYDFLINGKSCGNVPIYDNDIIMIPPYQKRAYLNGAFHREGYFELKDKDDFSTLLKYSGGFTSSAIKSHVGIFRVDKYGLIYKDFDATTDTKIALNNGDSIVVDKIDIERIDNSIYVEGAVYKEGYYEFVKGMKLSQLLEKAALKEEAFKNRAVITREKDDRTFETLRFNVNDVVSGSQDIELKDHDRIIIANNLDLRVKPLVAIRGAVKDPVTMEYYEGMTIGDLIIYAGGLTARSTVKNVEILRRLTDDVIDTSMYASAEVEVVTITRDLNIEDEGNSFLLRPYDVVSIRDIPSVNYNGTVTVAGDFLYPGEYNLINRKERISDLIERAGGLTSSANISGARLYRKYTLTEKEREIKMSTLDANADSMTIAKLNDHYELVTLDLEYILKHKGSDADLILLHGDELFIPTHKQTVRVLGNVLNPYTAMYKKGMSAKKYIKGSGGFAPRSKKNKVFVINSNGRSESTDHFLFFRRYPKVYPDSEIVVPQKPERESMTIMQLVSIMSSTVTMAAVIVALL